MIVKELEHLKEDERELVLQTPALISVLIGGVDEDFDEKEMNHAIKAVTYRSHEGEPLLFNYYKKVELSFKSVMLHFVQKYDGDPNKRAAAINAELSKLNDILPKLDERFARVLVDNWKSFAKGIAKASGGFLGYHQISMEESHVIELEMITYSA